MLTTVNERIAAVRELMKANGISAIIIPGADPHMSEYFSEHWATTTFISGFTGETGTVVITMDMAGLWTDGRYYIQAANELSGLVSALKCMEPTLEGSAAPTAGHITTMCTDGSIDDGLHAQCIGKR